MIFLQSDKIRCGKNEFRVLLMITILVWLKFFIVDYRIAEVLNWPSFGWGKQNIISYALRALAVGAPSLGAILCVIVPVSMLPFKYRGKVLIVLDLLFSILVLTDILFIRYYSDIFIFHDILLLPQTGLIAKSIWSLLKLSDILIFLDIPVIIWLMKKGIIPDCFNQLTKKRVIVSVLIIIIAVSVQCFAGLRLKTYRPNIINAMYDRLSVCAWVSASSFHFGDIFTLAAKSFRSDDVPDEKIREMRKWFSIHEKPNYNPIAKGKNLIMIQCEALQYFILDLKINGMEVTPNLNRFRKECLFFSNGWNQTAGGLSSDSEFMANTGMFPSASGAVYTRFADNNYNSLAGNLKKIGYKSVVLQGTNSAFWNCNRMHPKLYFDRDYSRNTFPNGEIIGLGLSDRTIFTEALHVFKTFDHPFYGFIITLSGHHPFDFEGLNDGTFPIPGALKGSLLGSYLTAMHYFDREFGRFLTGMRESGLIDKSLIVVYGDHPAVPIAYKEELENLLGEKIEGTISWKKTRRVPIMFYIPGKEKLARTDDTDTGQLDILPTVAGLMGLKIETVFGKDLLGGNGKRPVVFRNGSYVINGVYVEPAIDRATEIGTHKKLDALKYSVITKNVQQQLQYNDLILEKNLIKKILNY